ncbi:MAG: glycosyl hydrolase family 28 protein [Verrucomicrobia bacterium]|nr:glycosyl hydrolase family 28 protein [Verrucomicrobiota bacterium]
MQGSPNIADYDVMEAGEHKDLQPYHLLVLDGLRSVRITGPGCIDGSGPSFWAKEPKPSGWYYELDKRPSPMIECIDCEDLVWEGVKIANSPGWTLHFKRCRNVRVEGITIANNLFGPNTDGIDINGCQDVRVSNCVIAAGDDAIVLKTTDDSIPCERVVVTNCVIDTNCRALKLGAHESYLDMRDVCFSNCVVRQSVAVFAFTVAMVRLWKTLSAITLLAMPSPTRILTSLSI